MDFHFHNLKFSLKGILYFHATTATDTCIEEVIDSYLRRALLRKIMETLKALILTIIVLNLVSKGFSFYYNVIITGSSATYCKQFIVPFRDSSSRPEVLLKILQN